MRTRAATEGVPELSPEQRQAVDQLLSSGSPVQALGGYAGTGKTTVIKHLALERPNFAVCAFTGKAANVLRRKGVEASTIHSLIYEPHRCEGKAQVEWRVKDGLGCGGVIVDEASMVGETLYRDLSSFELPLIFVGDHGQLEPVGDHDFNLMASPDVTLETVHRNAGEIAHFANYVRKGNPAAAFRGHRDYLGDRVHIIKSCPPDDEILDYDQVICGTNPLRVEFNKIIREAFGYPADRPVVGDRVMCLQNDRRTGVFNGQQGTIKEFTEHDEMIFEADGDEYEVRFSHESFNRATRPEKRATRSRIPFDYAYCVTCHKAQGDEWDRVLVLEQRRRFWDHARWSYTAASRARLRVDWATS